MSRKRKQFQGPWNQQANDGKESWNKQSYYRAKPWNQQGYNGADSLNPNGRNNGNFIPEGAKHPKQQKGNRKPGQIVSPSRRPGLSGWSGAWSAPQKAKKAATYNVRPVSPQSQPNETWINVSREEGTTVEKIQTTNFEKKWLKQDHCKLRPNTGMCYVIPLRALNLKFPWATGLMFRNPWTKTLKVVECTAGTLYVPIKVNAVKHDITFFCTYFQSSQGALPPPSSPDIVCTFQKYASTTPNETNHRSSVNLKYLSSEEYHKVPRQDPSVTVSLIRAKFQEERQSEIATESIQLSLICPLSRKRIEIPCRPKNCDHIQCFDLETYVQMKDTKKTSSNKMDKCPICHNKTENLNIDLFFLDLLNHPDTLCKNNVELKSDGSWHVATSKENEELLIQIDQK